MKIYFIFRALNWNRNILKPIFFSLLNFRLTIRNLLPTVYVNKPVNGFVIVIKILRKFVIISCGDIAYLIIQTSIQT
jgi:hypothetical protein